MFVARSGGGEEEPPTEEAMKAPSKLLQPYEKAFI
jgi:hypothetical protein